MELTITDKPQAADELTALKQENSALRDKVRELEDDDDSLDWGFPSCDSPHLLEDEVYELAKARTALFNGRCDEGREMLERVLDRTVGDKWRLYT